MANVFNPNRFRPDPKPAVKEKAKPKPIKKEGKKRAVESKQYTVLRKLFLANKICQVNQCGPATEIHHTYSGKDRDAHYLDVKTWMAVCSECHRWIHRHPADARKLNYLK